MSLTIAPLPIQQFFDEDGDPLAGGFLYTYAAGTSTPATTYSDSSGTAHQNPITLNAGGWIATAVGTTTGLYLDATSYKFILKNSALVTIWTQDNIGSIGLTTSGVYDIFTFEGDSSSPITATSYPSGTTADKCHAGTGWLPIDSANIAAGTYKLSGMLLSSDGIITVTAAIVNLSDGAPDTPLATIASTSATGANVLSNAITFAGAGASKTYAIKAKVSAGYGLAWNLQLVKVA